MVIGIFAGYVDGLLPGWYLKNVPPSYRARLKI
jgi:hypothetical protein